MNAVEHELERVEALARFSPGAQRRTYELVGLPLANDLIRRDRAMPGLVAEALDSGMTEQAEHAVVHETQRAVASAARHAHPAFAAEFEHAERLSLALWSSGHHEVIGEPDFGGDL